MSHSPGSMIPGSVALESTQGCELVPLTFAQAQRVAEFGGPERVKRTLNHETSTALTKHWLWWATAESIILHGRPTPAMCEAARRVAGDKCPEGPSV